MKKGKILSMLLAATLLASTFAGCGSKKTSEVKANGKLDKSPITLSFFTADSTVDMPFTDPVAKEITKRTGVTLKITHPVAGDSQAIPLMIASGDYPDIIYAKGDTAKLIDAGAIIKLDDYIKKDGANLKALYGKQIGRLKYSAKDPSIYTVGTYGVESQIFKPGGTAQIQMAVLKDEGYPTIKTFDDYENAIKKYVQKYPTINGKKTIGMSLMASDWRWAITCGNIAGYAAGIPDDGSFKVDDKTGKCTYKYTLPEVEQYFKWLNKMNAEGLLDPESFTQKEDAYRAKIAQGTVLGLSDSDWDYSTAIQQLVGSGMTDRTYAPLPVTLGSQYKDQSLKDYGFSGGWGIAISSTSKHKERAFQFLDWMASDEAQVLVNWGVEGKDYKVVNGKRQLLPEVQKQKNSDKDFQTKTGIGNYIYPFPERGVGAKDKNGDYYTTDSLESVMANYNSAEKETIAAYKKKSWCDFFTPAKELGQPRHGQVWQYSVSSTSDASVIQKKADDYVQKAVTQAILGKPEDFDKAYTAIRKELKSYGIDKLEDEMTKMTKEKIKLWN